MSVVPDVTLKEILQILKHLEAAIRERNPSKIAQIFAMNGIWKTHPHNPKKIYRGNEIIELWNSFFEKMQFVSLEYDPDSMIYDEEEGACFVEWIIDAKYITPNSKRRKHTQTVQAVTLKFHDRVAKNRVSELQTFVVKTNPTWVGRPKKKKNVAKKEDVNAFRNTTTNKIKDVAKGNHIDNNVTSSSSPESISRNHTGEKGISKKEVHPTDQDNSENENHDSETITSQNSAKHAHKRKNGRLRHIYKHPKNSNNGKKKGSYNRTRKGSYNSSKSNNGNGHSSNGNGRSRSHNQRSRSGQNEKNGQNGYHSGTNGQKAHPRPWYRNSKNRYRGTNGRAPNGHRNRSRSGHRNGGKGYSRAHKGHTKKATSTAQTYKDWQPWTCSNCRTFNKKENTRCEECHKKFQYKDLLHHTNETQTTLEQNISGAPDLPLLEQQNTHVYSHSEEENDEIVDYETELPHEQETDEENMGPLEKSYNKFEN